VSESFGEASIFIRPDLSKFRAELIAGLTEATKGVAVKIPALAAGATGVAKVSAANTELAKSQRQAGVAAASLASEEGNLARAQGLQAAAAEKLVAVEKADELSTTALAGAKAKLSAALKALAAAQKANEAALATENAELKANAAETLAAAEATVALTRATAAEGVAHARTASEEAAHAAQHHALTTGARAAGASLTGLRGATLATSSGFLIGAASVKLFEESIHEASAEAEAGARAEKVFGDNAAALEENAKGLAASFGLSAKEALDFEGRLGNLFHNAGIAADESAGLSEQLVKLAADMAAFANVPVADTLKAINLGLVGNSRGLRQYQVELNQARVNQEALRISGKEQVDQLSQEDRIRARVNLLLQQTTNQQGAAAARAGELAQKEKILAAELANLGAEIGRVVIPIVTELATNIEVLISDLEKAKSLSSDVFGSLGIDAKDAEGHTTLFGKALHIAGEIEKDTIFPLRGLHQAIGIVSDAFDDGSSTADEFAAQLADMIHPVIAAISPFIQFGKAVNAVESDLEIIERTMKRVALASDRISFRAANNQLDTLKEKMTDVKIAGGGLDAQLAVLQQQEGKARAAVAAAERITELRPGSPEANDKRRSAKDNLADIIEQERQIRQEQADNAKNAAEAIAKAAQDAADFVKQKLEEAQQAILDAFTVEESRNQLQATRADRTDSLVDNLRFLEARRDIFEKEIVVLRKSGFDAQTILDKEIQLAEINNEIAATREQQAQNRADRARERIQNQEASLDADIEFAQIKKDTSAEIKAHEAKIKFINQQIAHTKKGTLEWKRLRNERAQEEAAIKDLRKQNDKLREDLQAMQFEFLQTQSGFAANVLSNILPTDVVAGTVGGSAISTTTPVPRGDSGQIQRRGQGDFGAGTASATAAGGRGASAGQMSTLISISRQQLAILARLSGRNAHPEATNQRIHEAAAMDFIGW
jgi:hypothetical protein